MEKGNSFETFSGVIRVAPSTLYSWLEIYEDFLEAAQIGQSLSLLFWENLGLRGVQGQVEGFRDSTFAIYMRNRFKWDKHYSPLIPGAIGQEKTRKIDEGELRDDAQRLVEAIREGESPLDDILPPEPIGVQSPTHDEREANPLVEIPLASGDSKR
jgi:hypothetical protein